MSEETIRKFYEHLVRSAEQEGEEYNKPIFVAAALQYILKNNLHGLTIDELMYMEHIRRIKKFFLSTGRNVLTSPESSWRKMTNPRSPIIRNLFTGYDNEQTHLGDAFTQLKPYTLQKLVKHFKERIDSNSS